MKLRPSLDWLLVFLPLTIALDLSGSSHTLVFFSACLAIIPLAGLMGRATEELASRMGEGVGGLLNATFGNAAELIIAFAAIREGMYEIVKASLTGSIIGNLLLVLGFSFLSGGLKFKVQRFNPMAARSRGSMLLMAAVALIAPAAFHSIEGEGAAFGELRLSLIISIILFVTYILGLVFALHTHRAYFAGGGGDGHRDADALGWSLARALVTLLSSTALIAWASEILVGSVEETAAALGMNDIFVGVIVVAVVGNAAEHSTAVMSALKNKPDLSIEIAVGSSIQIALFVTPLVLFASYFMGPEPMNLVFTPAEVLSVVLAVVICGQITEDGESNWLEGVQLLSVYLIIGVLFYFL